MSADFEEELEVVQAIYGDDNVRVLPALAGEDFAKRVEVDLQPRVEQGAALVSVTIQMDLPRGYPDTALPRVRVERSRGLGDAALGKLMLRASQAVEEYGGKGVGCVSQLLADVSDVLDVANESSECNICLGACQPGDKVVRPPCDHIFHAWCLGHWAGLKDKDAEDHAEEASRSVRSKLDSLRREVVESERRHDAAQDAKTRANSSLARASRMVEVAREWEKASGNTDLEYLFQVEHGSEAAFLFECDFDSDRLHQQLKICKSRAQQAADAERKSQARMADVLKNLDAVEEVLAQEASARQSASLPCPVCRVAIERHLFREECGLHGVVRDGEAEGEGRTALLSMPIAVQEQVRAMQRRNEVTLSRRREKELQQLEAQVDVLQHVSQVVSSALDGESDEVLVDRRVCTSVAQRTKEQFDRGGRAVDDSTVEPKVAKGKAKSSPRQKWRGGVDGGAASEWSCQGNERRQRWGSSTEQWCSSEADGGDWTSARWTDASWDSAEWRGSQWNQTPARRWGTGRRR